jgi:hypothetical protein
MTALIQTSGLPRVAARANCGRWIVDCPRVPKHALWMDPGDPYFVCWACGTAAEVVWPSEQMVLGIERLLMMRPDEDNRSWSWPETLHDLLQENVENGVMRGEVGDDLAIEGDVITKDTFPAQRLRLNEAFQRQLELQQQIRKAIGAS